MLDSRHFDIPPHTSTLLFFVTSYVRKTTTLWKNLKSFIARKGCIDTITRKYVYLRVNQLSIDTSIHADTYETPIGTPEGQTRTRENTLWEIRNTTIFMDHKSKARVIKRLRLPNYVRREEKWLYYGLSFIPIVFYCDFIFQNVNYISLKWPFVIRERY